jgi:uncharacterized membrane protein
MRVWSMALGMNDNSKHNESILYIKVLTEQVQEPTTVSTKDKEQKTKQKTGEN